MPKRLRPEELEAARAAGEAPLSEHYPGDDGAWHDAQENWLARWHPGMELPARGNTKRRTDWNALTKKHQRHFEAEQAEDKSHGSLPTPSEAPARAAPPPVDVPAAEYSRGWELHSLRVICLGRGVEYSVSDTNEDLLTKLAASLRTPPALVMGSPGATSPPAARRGTASCTP